MARSRNIKPGFFTNEDLVELDFSTRLLFAGLWTVADRAGRLQDRPKKIKIDVFPADNLDINAMLQALHDGGFIERYAVDGSKFIQILNWSKHQNPHHTEKASDIPDKDGCLTVKTPLETKHIAKQDGEYLADSLLLIPDSLVIHSLSESAIPSGPADQKPNSEKPDSKKSPVPLCPFDAVIDAYESALPDLPSVTRSLFRDGVNGKATAQRWAWVLTATHEKGSKKGLRLAVTHQDGIDWFTRFFAYAAGSEFLTGANGKFPGCNLGWLVTKANFEKVLAGNYHMEKAA